MKAGTEAATKANGKRSQNGTSGVLNSLARLVGGFSPPGRDLLARHTSLASAGPGPRKARANVLATLARDLLSGRGEASGVAIAADLLALYRAATKDERIEFLGVLGERFNPDQKALEAACRAYAEQGAAALRGLSAAVEAPRQELFRRLNLAPGGTAALVAMRADLLQWQDEIAAGDVVDADLLHVLKSWFNRGFLTMREISWTSPASLLERLIAYEAVHHIRDWADLRRRLDPADRRCFGFFHPAMPDDPLIFVEVALTRQVPRTIQPLLDAAKEPVRGRPDTAVFYSISNCQPGLRGVPFGNFLIKQVATDLKRDLPGLKRFVTLSPVPGFMRWLAKVDADLAAELAGSDWIAASGDELQARVTRRAVAYFLDAKGADGKPLDPVARFHLGNGARLEMLNWLGDVSPKGLRQSAGLMVNYLYDVRSIEERHEAYANEGRIAVGKPFRDMAHAAGVRI